MQRFNCGGAKLFVAVIMALLPASLSADIIVVQGGDTPFPAFWTNADFNNGDIGSTVTGTVGVVSRDVNVTSGAGDLTVQGQQVEAVAGLFNNVTIQTDPGFAFNILSFNLNVSADGMVTFSTAPSGISLPTSDTYSVDANGENRFTLFALNPQSLASVTISLDTGGLEDIKQIRAGVRSALEPSPFGDDPAIPEPSTWVLMSAGVVGLIIRRRFR